MQAQDETFASTQGPKHWVNPEIWSEHLNLHFLLFLTLSCSLNQQLGQVGNKNVNGIGLAHQQQEHRLSPACGKPRYHRSSWGPSRPCPAPAGTHSCPWHWSLLQLNPSASLQKGPCIIPFLQPGIHLLLSAGLWWSLDLVLTSLCGGVDGCWSQPCRTGPMGEGGPQLPAGPAAPQQ